MPLFSSFGRSVGSKGGKKSSLCESDAYASHESRIGVYQRTPLQGEKRNKRDDEERYAERRRG